MLPPCVLGCGQGVCVCLFAMCPKRGVSAAALKVVHESWFSIKGHDVQEGMQ